MEWPHPCNHCAVYPSIQLDCCKNAYAVILFMYERRSLSHWFTQHFISVSTQIALRFFFFSEKRRKNFHSSLMFLFLFIILHFLKCFKLHFLKRKEKESFSFWLRCVCSMQKSNRIKFSFFKVMNSTH